MNLNSRPKRDWINIAFLGTSPIVGIIGTALYTAYAGFEWWMLGLLVVSYFLVGVSICGGYHRLFSHRAYDASSLVQVFYAFFGAMAAQNSILRWCSMHRTHHKYVDQEWDPYSIKRGFWWAHIVWIFHKNPDAGNYDNSPDLEANPIVRWQHRWTTAILIIGGFGLPTLAGWMLGDAIAGLLWGGFLRVVLVHHSTFFVNSLAHTLGTPSYAADVSARDNGLVALLTLGEGYHSFHHRFASDYRNGIRWFHWDPTKWFIRILQSAGLATNLRITPSPVIERARMQVAMRMLEVRIASLSEQIAAETNRRLEAAREAMDEAAVLWRQYLSERAAGMRKSWRETRSRARSRVRDARREWNEAMRLLAQVAELA